MSIVRVSELSGTTEVTNGSLFYVSYGNGPNYDSKHITKENLFKDYVTTGTTRFFGAFSSTLTQTGASNTEKVVTFNSTDYSNGVTLVNNSQLKVANAGYYNLQFSAQIYRTGGGTEENFYIWFKKNGNTISNSNTAVTISNNSHYIVVGWNFISYLGANDYIEIAWGTTDSAIEITALTPTIGPSIPSVIATLIQI